jgi:hypothetical protein
MPDAAVRTPVDKVLRRVLQISGSVLLLAFFAIFLPVDWMAAAHRWLGLGDFPASPLVDYLTRSASALYAIHGGLLWVLSKDPQRFRPVILYVAMTGLAMGVVILFIDLHAGMPAYWTIAEGPPLVVLGGVVLWLARRL